MKAPITTAQAMSHPTVVETINTLGKMCDELRNQNAQLLEALKKIATCQSRVKGDVVDIAQTAIKEVKP